MPRSKRSTPPERGVIYWLAGLWFLVHDVADRMMHAGAEAAAETLPAELLAEAEKAENHIKAIVRSLGLATKKDIAELEKKIDELSELLS